MKDHYKFWIIFSFVIIFAAGLTGGIFLEKHLLLKKFDRTRRGPARFHSLEVLARELNLTSEQQGKIREIFKNNEERFKGLSKDFFERLSTIRSQLTTEIKNVLTAEQAKKFDALLEKYAPRRREAEEKRENHPPRHEKQREKGEKR